MAEFRIAEASCTPGLSQEMLQAISELGPYDAIFYDGLRQGQRGFTPAEDVIIEPLRRVLTLIPGDLLTPFIASKVNLIHALSLVATETNGHLSARGGSMVRTFERCYEAGWIPQPGRLRSGQKTILAVTGSQSEPGSFLDRLTEGQSRQLMRDDFILVVQGAIPMYRETIAKMYQDLAQRLPDGGILLTRAEKRRLRLSGPNIYSIEDFIGLPPGQEIELSSGHGKDADHEKFLECSQRLGSCPNIFPFQVDKKNRDVVDDMGEVTEVSGAPIGRLPLPNLVDRYFRSMRSTALPFF